LQDEEAFVTVGPLHPQPPQPRWMGPVPPARSDATPVGSNNGEAMNVDAGGPSRWQEHLAPHDTVAVAQNAAQAHFADVEKEAGTQNVLNGIESQGFESAVMPNTTAGKFPVLDAVKGPFPTLRYVIVGPSTASDPLVTVVLSIIRKVLNFITSNPSSNFLRFLSLLDIIITLLSLHISMINTF